MKIWVERFLRKLKSALSMNHPAAATTRIRGTARKGVHVCVAGACIPR